MAIESATYISELNAANPTATDNFGGQSAQQMRLVKSVILNSFPGVSGAVTASHTELNYVDGATSAIQDQLNAKRSLSIEGGKTSNFTAQAGKLYVLTAASSTRTMTLPASPSAGDIVYVVRAYTTGSNWTVARNGEKIMGAAADDTITSLVVAYKYIYVDSTTGWARFNA